MQGRIRKVEGSQLIPADRGIRTSPCRREKAGKREMSKPPKFDATQGYASRASMRRPEYEALVSSPQFLIARIAHARSLPEAKGKEDYAEFLALHAFDYSTAELAERLAAFGDAGFKSAGFSEFLQRKSGALKPVAATPPAPLRTQQRTSAPAAKSSSDLWAEVIAEKNAELRR
jgi:hypothetical protein